MSRVLRGLTQSTETLLIQIIALVLGIFYVLNPTVLTIGHFVSLSRGSIVIGFLAIGVLLVLLSGGIDVSFTAVAAASMYTTVTIFNGLESDPGILLLGLCSLLIGALLGSVNAWLVVWLKIPTLLVTLGMLSVIRGGLLFFVGTERIRDVPESMIELSKARVGSFSQANGGVVGFHVSFLLLIAVAILVWAFLRWSVLGRTIIALGSNREAASRLGMPVKAAESFVYVMVGALAGLTGLLSASLIRQADPFSLVGEELTVIAAVVLGGASITGGRGTVFGTFLGVALIGIVGGSLILVGIPTEFQLLIVGVFLLLGVVIPAVQGAREGKRRGEPRVYKTSN